MPLSVEVHRDNEPLQLRWGWFHLEAIQTALESEGKTLNDYDYPLQRDHTFRDVTDGEIFELKTGDRIRAWR